MYVYIQTNDIKQCKLAILLLAIKGHLEVLLKVVGAFTVSYSIITAMVDRKHSLHILGNLITAGNITYCVPTTWGQGERERERERKREGERERDRESGREGGRERHR